MLPLDFPAILVALTIVALLAECPAHSRQLRRVSPAECMPRQSDYGFIWWAQGYPGRSPHGRWLRAIQTGQYGMAMDIDQLRPSDYVEATIEHVIMPQFAHDYYGPNQNLRKALQRHQNTWRMIHREAVGNDLQVDVTEGQLVRERPTQIRANNDRARFTITGGLGYVPVTIGGLSDYREPVLEMRTPDTDWRRIDQSVHGNDYWQTDYAPADRNWQVTYSLPLDTPGDRPHIRRFRFAMQ